MTILSRWWFRGVLLVLTLLALGTTGVAASSWQTSGARAEAARLERIRQSPQWDRERAHFVDPLPRTQASFWTITSKFLTSGSEFRAPRDPVPFRALKASDFSDAPKCELCVVWLGHSTSIVEIDGKRLLIDPVFGDRASPVSWAGPKRFYPPPLPLSELPPIDAIVISHDHYDHLDHPTILQLKQRTRAPFFVPLGVGAHLAYWGVEEERIVELDWWQERAIGDVTLVATPSRHFSGRSPFFTDRDATLWAGWAFIGPKHRVFYSGDTAMFPGFAEIGARLGPFDVTLIESGAYDSMWRDVHLGPEQAVEAHRMLRGKHMIPVHWGLFDLALHGWTEPVERVRIAAEAAGVALSTPVSGTRLDFGAPPTVSEPWWPELPFETAQRAPVVSSNLGFAVGAGVIDVGAR